MPTDDAVTVWLGQLQAGKSSAVRPLWDKYFHRLVGLARKRLKDSSRQVADEEDVALSAFDSFCRHAEAGRFRTYRTESVCGGFGTFTLRKAAHHQRDALRVKRGGGIVADMGSAVLDEVVSREPEPALAVEVAEECERLLSLLGDAELRRVAVLRMDGHSVEEVAAKIGCAPRSVKRKLQLIRDIWAGEAEHEAE